MHASAEPRVPADAARRDETPSAHDRRAAGERGRGIAAEAAGGTFGNPSVRKLRLLGETPVDREAPARVIVTAVAWFATLVLLLTIGGGATGARACGPACAEASPGHAACGVGRSPHDVRAGRAV